MTDAQFAAEIQNTLAEYHLGGLRGWIFTHIPLKDWCDNARNKLIVLTLPVVEGIPGEDLLTDILKQHPNHTPCSWCADHMEAPPRGELCTGYIPAHTSNSGEGKVWRGYLCEQCAEELTSVRWK